MLCYSNNKISDLLEKTENGRESLTIQPYDYNPNWETGDKRKLKIICEVRLCSKFGPDALGCQVTETCKNERPNSFLDQVGRKRRQGTYIYLTKIRIENIKILKAQDFFIISIFKLTNRSLLLR